MIEYPAMIYKNNRNQSYIANCMTQNLIGFGKTEEDAIKNLKESIKTISENKEIDVIPVYGLQIAQ